MSVRACVRTSVRCEYHVHACARCIGACAFRSLTCSCSSVRSIVGGVERYDERARDEQWEGGVEHQNLYKNRLGKEGRGMEFVVRT